VANPDLTKPRDDVSLANARADNLTHSQLKVAEDYIALRRHADASPDVAAALTQAIQTYELRLAVGGLLGLLRDWTRDPMRAVSWVRQFDAIRTNIAEADDKILKGHADEQFEAALKAMRDQLPPLEGGAE
jgi:hypothetical protein